MRVLSVCAASRVFFLRRGGVDHGGVQHLARGIHHGDLAARAVRGIQSQRHLAADGRLHQQRAQIGGEQRNGLLLRALRKIGADLALQRGEDQPLQRVVRRLFHQLAAGVGRLDKAVVEDALHRALRRGDAHLQKAFLFAAVDREDAVAGDARARLCVVVIHRVDRLLFRIGRLCADGGAALQIAAQALARRRVVGDHLGKDVVCALHDLLKIHVLRDVVLAPEFGVAQHLLPDGFRQLRQSLFPCNGCARAALGAVGAVDVLDLRKRCSAVQRLADLLGIDALFFNGGAHLAAACLHLAQICQAFGQCAQHLIVHRAGLFLAVTRDKGDGVALVDQRDDVAHRFLRGVKFQRKLFCDFQSGFLLNKI